MRFHGPSTFVNGQSCSDEVAFSQCAVRHIRDACHSELNRPAMGFFADRNWTLHKGQSDHSHLFMAAKSAAFLALLVRLKGFVQRAGGCSSVDVDGRENALT